MEDMKLKAKQKVLEQIMEMMDGLENESLKKHPKLMKVSVMAKDPNSMQDGLEKAEDVVEQIPEQEEKMPDMLEKKEDELDPEMIQKIVEMYKNLK